MQLNELEAKLNALDNASSSSFYNSRADYVESSMVSMPRGEYDMSSKSAWRQSRDRDIRALRNTERLTVNKNADYVIEGTKIKATELNHHLTTIEQPKNASAENGLFLKFIAERLQPIKVAYRKAYEVDDYETGRHYEYEWTSEGKLQNQKAHFWNDAIQASRRDPAVLAKIADYAVYTNANDIDGSTRDFLVKLRKEVPAFGVILEQKCAVYARNTTAGAVAPDRNAAQALLASSVGLIRQARAFFGIERATTRDYKASLSAYKAAPSNVNPTDKDTDNPEHNGRKLTK